MKATVLDLKGNTVEEITLSDKVFGVKPNLELLAQYVRVYNANQRQGTASTKTKGEVSGGGRKPWKQKGTGRARQGSIRSPQWVHGGVAHGPKPKDWSLGFPKKMNSLAILAALSQKFAEDNALIINELPMKAPKTKELVEILKALKLDGKTLIVLAKSNLNLRLAGSNITKLAFAQEETLNAHELLNAKKVLFLKESIKKLEEKYK
jgi:large subunit ribosomal protein L4